MSADEGAEDSLGGLSLVCGVGGEGLEQGPELLIGAALVLLEDEGIGADPEGPGAPRRAASRTPNPSVVFDRTFIAGPSGWNPSCTSSIAEPSHDKARCEDRRDGPAAR